MATEAVRPEVHCGHCTPVVQPLPGDTYVAAAPPGTVYACPMHPEIRQDQPGNCPKCGMTLEPALPLVGADDNQELAGFQ